LTPVLNSQGMKKLRYAIQKKYKNQAGMNLSPPPPSQNIHAVGWHCTAESERRVAEINYYYYDQYLSLAAARARTADIDRQQNHPGCDQRHSYDPMRIDTDLFPLISWLIVQR